MAGPEALTVAPPSAVAPADPFADLALILAAVVDDNGAIDPTALAVQQPKLDRLLSNISTERSVETGVTNDRLAWLYNARTAWSLRILARELRPAGHGDGRFALPATIPPRRLLESPFPLDGRTMTLADIDRELLQWNDFRIVAAAPGGTDWFGPLPREPFRADTVLAAVDERFNRYAADPRRLVVDYAGHRFAVPPALWAYEAELRQAYARRFTTPDASLATALTPWLNARARDAMEDALGCTAGPRTDAPGIVATNP
jgi:hypothetical protein